MLDDTQQALVELCLEHIETLPVLLLMTARPTFEYGFGGHPIVTRLSLNRLGREQVSDIVTHITKGKSLPGEVLEAHQVHRHGQGAKGGLKARL